MAERGHAWVRDITSLIPHIVSSAPSLLALSILANITFPGKANSKFSLKNLKFALADMDVQTCSTARVRLWEFCMFFLLSVDLLRFPSSV